MIDFRLALALEVADQIGAQVLTERCPECQHPLMMKCDQNLPFDWFCTTDREAAQRGRTALTKARMAAKGILLQDDMHPHPILEKQIVDSQSSWIPGMAL